MPAFAMDGAHDAHDTMMEKKEVVVEKTMDVKDAVMEKESALEEVIDEKIVESRDALALEKPDVYALAFHSDNCGSCKILSPKLGEAASGFEADDLQVVRLDLTDDVTKAAALAQAEAHSWMNIYNEYSPKTGFALLVDSETNEVLAKITKTMSADEIKAEIQKNI